MWWKLCLLTVYMALLFLLSRLLETFVYYHGGFIPSRLLDPVSLSVKKLKLLLDQRGINHAGVIEKSELSDLIAGTGNVTEGELQAATSASEARSAVTNFTGGLNFNEEVEDSKDSVWVVQVIDTEYHRFISPRKWDALTQRLSHFSVRPGVFDCSLDRHFCLRKGWLRPCLVMAIPRGFRAKDTVRLLKFDNSTRLPSVFHWISRSLATRVAPINSVAELEREWLHFTPLQRQLGPVIRVLFLSNMAIPPMFLSVLSVKFTGRIKCATLAINGKKGSELLTGLINNTNISAMLRKQPRIPGYLIVTPEAYYIFGRQKGEYPTLNSLSLFLKTMYPEANDIFLLSIVIVNILNCLEVVVIPGSLLRKTFCFLCHLLKWNFLLMLSWLPTTTVFQLLGSDKVLSVFLMGVRLMSLTSVAAELRLMWLCYSTGTILFLTLTFVGYIISTALLRQLYQRLVGTVEDNTENIDHWPVSWDWYLRALFRPVAPVAQPEPPASNTELEVGMEMLIERLATPNFWLHPIISLDYIKELPVWRFTGEVVDSDVNSDADSPGEYSSNVHSDAEDNGDVSGTESVGSARSSSSFRLCEQCRRLSDSRSVQELEEERLASESAWAKYMMDGDYKCQCHQLNNHTREGRRHQQAQTANPAEAEDAHEDEEDPLEEKVPLGIIPVHECAICLEHYHYGCVLCGLPCGHSFHHVCIVGWLSRDNHCCPVCRWPPYKAKSCSLHVNAC